MPRQDLIPSCPIGDFLLDFIWNTSRPVRELQHRLLALLFDILIGGHLQTIGADCRGRDRAAPSKTLGLK